MSEDAVQHLKHGRILDAVGAIAGSDDIRRSVVIGTLRAAVRLSPAELMAIRHWIEDRDAELLENENGS